MRRMYNPGVLSLDSVSCYVAELDGQPVSTSVSPVQSSGGGGTIISTAIRMP
jgi:hypothetical protein